MPAALSGPPIHAALLFLCRQSIELWLKAALAAFSPGDPPHTGHDLQALWYLRFGALDQAGHPTDATYAAARA